VIVIDQFLGRPRTMALLDRGDCFVSLHRAEGFGRAIAEAMLLGKPAIATGYSGNEDFTTPETACVVPYTLVAVGPGEYPHATGQQWAEPDLAQAAAYMRRVVGDREWAAALGARGRALVAAQHGLAAVGARYRARLAELGFL
jgi:glycosyltransferase involved in cell wall biosynthesis